MNINSILKLARYHNLKGWIAIDATGYAYWYKDKPKYNKHTGMWMIQFGSNVTKNFCKLLCTKAEINLNDNNNNTLWHTKRIHIN